MKILCLETSTTVCSACIADENGILALREINNGYTHAENLHVFVAELLAEVKLEARDLSAVAVSKGPGSYTGLRIGVSAAKGFCYALNIPLISIGTLQAMTSVVKEMHPGLNYCPMLDARRMEVYCAVYNEQLKAVIPVQALILDETSIRQFILERPICFFGDGMPKAKSLLQSIPNAVFLEDVVPSATALAGLASEKFRNSEFENLALFEPFYLKEFYTRKS